MKIKVLKHLSIKPNIDDDFQKVVDYYNSNFVKQYINESIEFKIENTNLDIKDVFQLIISEKEYDAIMFVYETGTYPYYGQTFPTGGKIGIYLSVNQTEDNIDYSWKSMAHEILHAIVYKTIKEKQVFIPNYLDHPMINGVIQDYYGNTDPYLVGGNFEQQLEVLKPFYNMTSSILYKPQNFVLSELMPKKVIDIYGNKAWEFLDERMLRNLQFFRDNLGAIKVNSPTQQFRCFDNEFRKNGFSQHNHGRAVDCTFKNYTSEQVREWISKLENYSRLPEPNIWVEKGTPHFHFDVRFSEKKGVYFFNP